MEQKEKILISERQKIIECADGIIDYMSEQIIMQRVHEDFGDSLSLEGCVKIADKVYQQIKLRM